MTPLKFSHIQATIICSQHHVMQIRTRSGGHNYEGLSYVFVVPFVIIDLINLREIKVDVQNHTTWVQAGKLLVNFTIVLAIKVKHLGSQQVCATLWELVTTLVAVAMDS
ncbi:Cannabidiolic acid synthase, partial [Mucuna pruriens]